MPDHPVIGRITPEGFVIREQYSPSGYCFKDPNAFLAKNDICYVAELPEGLLFIEKYPLPSGFVRDTFGISKLEGGDTYYEYAYTYTYEDFLKLAGGNQKMTELIFEACEWQHPETEIMSLASIGIINCPHCGWMYDTEQDACCPKCNRVLTN